MWMELLDQWQDHLRMMAKQCTDQVKFIDNLKMQLRLEKLDLPAQKEVIIPDKKVTELKKIYDERKERASDLADKLVQLSKIDKDKGITALLNRTLHYLENEKYIESNRIHDIYHGMPRAEIINTVIRDTWKFTVTKSKGYIYIYFSSS